MIYFFSDSHVGSRAMADRAEHQQKLIRMLQMMGRDATEIHILGDLFDYWYEYLWHDSSKQEYQPLLDTLRSLTDRGIAVHFYIGNHDIWTFGALARRTGMIVHRRNVQTITVAGQRVVLGHGDGVVPSDLLQRIPPEFRRKIRRFIFLRRFFHNPIPQFLFRLLPPSWGNRLGYEWSRRSRVKELAHPCPYKGENHEEIVLWCKEQATLPPTDPDYVSYYIFGHRHIELDLMLRNRSRVLILGDTFRQWTYAALNPSTHQISIELYEEFSAQQ